MERHANGRQEFADGRIGASPGERPIGADGTAFNHYSLLGSYETAFGLPLLAHAGHALVPQMNPLFHP